MQFGSNLQFALEPALQPTLAVLYPVDVEQDESHS